MRLVAVAEMRPTAGEVDGPRPLFSNTRTTKMDTDTDLPKSKVKLSSLKADVEKQDEGDWQPIPELTGVKVKVRSLRSPKYQFGATPIRQRHVRKFGENGTVPNAEFAKSYGRLVADVILLDWDGFDEKFSREKALETLMDPGYAEVLGYIIAAAGRVAQGEVEYVEEAAKN
jgi:hypothetical protein